MSTVTLALDAHIYYPQEFTRVDGLIQGAVTTTTKLDAIVYGPAEIKFDAILVAANTDQKLISTKARNATFKTAIFSQEA